MPHPLDLALGLSRIDLHLHTIASDGKVTTSEVISLACDHHLKAVAITDHDAVDAFLQAHPGVQPNGVRLLTGVELDTHDRDCDPEVLGYGFDHTSPALADPLREIQARRIQRARQMMEVVNKALGQEVLTEEEVLVPGRITILKPHLTDILLSKSIFCDVARARTFLNTHTREIPFTKPSPEQAIEWIHEAGGKAALAHPAFYRKFTDLASLVKRLAKAGLDGLEGAYPYRFTPSVFPDIKSEQEAIAEIKGLAEKFGLLLTIGTDSHTLTDWQRTHPWPSV